MLRRAETPRRLFLSFPVPALRAHGVELKLLTDDEDGYVDSAKAGARKSGILVVVAVCNVRVGGIVQEMMDGFAS